ncbi:hypothetical protein [Bacillus mojavensis]
MAKESNAMTINGTWLKVYAAPFCEIHQEVADKLTDDYPSLWDELSKHPYPTRVPIELKSEEYGTVQGGVEVSYDFDKGSYVAFHIMNENDFELTKDHYATWAKTIKEEPSIKSKYIAKK